MIGRLTGHLVAEDPDGTVVLDVAGVGYELSVPAGTIGRIHQASSSTEPCTLFVHTHVREDAIQLFGFATPTDRQVFRILLGISKVGPRIALAILSFFAGAELAQAVESRDTNALTKVPGVGKKLAEMILIQLRDKTAQLFAGEGNKRLVTERARSTGTVVDQVVDALARMGFKPSEVERAVGALGTTVNTEPVEKVIREALVLLRR